MFDGTSLSRSRTFFFPGATGTVDFHNSWFDTLTGRLGYAVAPTWLLYVQGGGAWAHTSTNLTFNNVQIGQTGRTRSGWTVGGGVEWMFAPHWSAFLEGNWMDFGTKTFAVDPNLITCVVCSASVRASEATVLVGVNWRPW
jgi:outer membrane immunogenic protein